MLQYGEQIFFSVFVTSWTWSRNSRSEAEYFCNKKIKIFKKMRFDIDYELMRLITHNKNTCDG